MGKPSMNTWASLRELARTYVNPDRQRVDYFASGPDFAEQYHDKPVPVPSGAVFLVSIDRGFYRAYTVKHMGHDGLVSPWVPHEYAASPEHLTLEDGRRGLREAAETELSRQS